MTPGTLFARGVMIFITLSFCGIGVLAAQEEGSSTSSGGGGDAAGSSQGTQGGSEGSLPAPAPQAGAQSFQVESPSVTLPTPDLPLPPPLQESTPEPQATPAPRPEFNPPTAESLNLPSSQPAGNPQSAPASVGMPSVKLDESASGTPDSGPGPLGGIFDWARKLLFNAAVRGGYDSNINSSRDNAIASPFANLNGGVRYRFGAPRLHLSTDLTGGYTYYSNAGKGSKGGASSKQNQGVIGLGLSVEYRFSPRLVLTYNTSTSFQQQPNTGLIGTSQNQNGSYLYTANSFSAAYQWSELFTTVTRLNFTANFYLQKSLNQDQGFSQPGFSQSFRWLLKPTTTAVLDYNTDIYGYGQSGNHSWGQSLAGGFDHTFNPRWFWNFRAGAEFRTFQNSNHDGTYTGPYVDSNFNWDFGKSSRLAWLVHVGTQPSGQQNVSYSAAFRTGLNYTQDITSRLKFNMGALYLLQNFQDSSYGPVVNGKATTTNYNQTNLQGNLGLTYILNRILQLDLGYQYLSSLCPDVPSQEYTRGISYLQLGGSF
jgi:hypothetical protein